MTTKENSELKIVLVEKDTTRSSPNTDISLLWGKSRTYLISMWLASRSSEGTCPYYGCTRKDKFESEIDLATHIETKHKTMEGLVGCPYPRCNRVVLERISYLDDFQWHLENVHRMQTSSRVSTEFMAVGNSQREQPRAERIVETNSEVARLSQALSSTRYAQARAESVTKPELGVSGETELRLHRIEELLHPEEERHRLRRLKFEDVRAKRLAKLELPLEHSWGIQRMYEQGRPSPNTEFVVLSNDTDNRDTQVSGLVPATDVKDRDMFVCNYPDCGKIYTYARRNLFLLHLQYHRDGDRSFCAICNRPRRNDESYREHQLSRMHKLNLGTRTAYSQMKETSLKGQLKKRSANDAKATIYSRRSIVAEGSDTIINDDQELLPNSNNQLHHAATTTTRSVPEHTDSGYASLPRRSEKSSFGLQMTAPAKQDDDDATVYSTASSVGTVAKDSYIEAMARLLWQEIHSLRVDNLSLKDISPALCDLLGQFALRFSSSNPDDMHQRIMIFVHKYRRQIASVFEKIEPQKHNDEDENSTTDSEPGMSVDEKMALWTIETEKPEIEYVPIELPEDHREEDRDLANHLESLVVNDPSYEWLVRRVQRVALCTPSEVQSAIADNITKRIGHGRNVSRKMVSNKPKVSIYISSWDLRAFVQEQAIDARAKDSKDLCFDTIENIITITSSSRSECQALTCGEYLEMIWPELGQEVLHAIWTMILDDKAHLSLKDGTSISAAMNNDSMSVQLEGTVYAIAEVVEILSWLSAALRTSEENIATCLPIISETSFEGQSYPSFKISYSVQELESKGNGQCWHKMFRSSMVVLGYPIRRRAAMLGLEISLPVVTKLLCSDRMNVFNGKLILKGFSAMLLPTDQNGDFVQWHYIYQKKGDYLDFSAADSFDGAGVNERDMRKRHVIGWCSDAKVIAGAPGPYYSIQRSHLPKSNASIALKSFALSAGSQPGALLEASIAICIKDRPIHVSPAGLGIVDKLRWISQRYVVLYDSQEKRGWLINGVNALLHLLRASLEAYYTDKFNSALKLQPSHITEPTTEYPDAAIDFFLRDGHKNLQLELYVKRFETFMESTKSSTAPGTAKLKTTSVLVQDRVEDLFDILAHAITQQMDMAKREGIYYKPHFKKFLDGWDFKNIATDHSPFEPVVASLDCFQQPWVNMIRALNIPVLFGKGFGEIIQPAKTEQICSRWTTLPKDKIYLAATVATMKKIMERHGDDSAKPMKICDKMLWFHPSSSYSSCQCHNRKDRKHIDNVQVLWPEGLKSKLLRNEAAAHLSANGAVVFGQNNHFSWFRNDCGVAVEGIFRFRRSKSRGEAAAAAEEEEEEEEDFGSIIPAPELSSETSPSINSLSIASASDSTNKLSNSTSSQQSTAQTDPSLTQQTVRSSFSTQTNPSIRLKRKGRLPWLKFDAGEQA